MVQISTFVGVVALLSSFAAGLPRPRPQDDSAIGIEVGVSAPNGIPLTNSVELASQLSREAAARTAAPATTAVYRAYRYGGVAAEDKPAEHVTTPVAAHVTTPVHQVTSSPVHKAPEHQVTSSPVHKVEHQVTTVHKAPEHQVTSKAAAHVTTPAHVTTSAAAHQPAATYGSGSANWGNPEYNDCVSKCLATYGQAPAQYVPTGTNNPVAHGTGATHTVIVAPTQGVLRYIPFAVNASVGDTIKFMWGANNHTVTKSSALLPCNRTGDALFASGIQNKDFVFTQVVNDTKPTYFHCATPGHCQKGMFGIINPAINFASPSSVGFQMQSLAQKNPTIAAYADLTNKATTGNADAARWGSTIDMEALPGWAHEFVAENVLYTRQFLAANPEVMKEGGAIDLSTSDNIPLSIPQDIAAALNNAGTTPSPAPAAESPSAAPAVPSGVTDGANTDSGVGNVSTPGAGVSNVASSKVLLAIVVVATTLLL